MATSSPCTDDDAAIRDAVAAWGYVPGERLEPGFHTQWVIRARSRRNRAVVITRGREVEVVAAEARALLHWRKTGVTPMLYDMPDAWTLVLEDIAGPHLHRVPDGGAWAAVDVGRALGILHRTPPDDADPPRAEDAPPRLSGLTRDLAGRAGEIIRRAGEDTPPVILHGDPTPANMIRARTLRIIDPRWTWGQPAAELARYAALVAPGDPLRALRGAWRGWGQSPGRVDLAHGARALAHHLQHVRNRTVAGAEEPLAAACERLLAEISR